MRVLCLSVYPAHAPSVYHRVYAYRPLWARRGLELTVHSFLDERFYLVRKQFGLLATVKKGMFFLRSSLRLFAQLATVGRYDAVIIHREYFPLGPPWVERLVARLSKFCIFDLDDATWHPPSHAVDQRKVFWYHDRVKEMMASASVVVAGNPYIAGYARQVNHRVEVIPTSYEDLGDFHNLRDQSAKPVVVWIGNLGNAEYLESILPILRRVCQSYPFILRLIGGKDLAELPLDGLEVDIVQWNREDEAAQLASAHIGVMPLYDRDHEKGKCAFKLIQYFSAGLPVIASPVGMNADVVQHGKNGFLANSMEDWSDSLSQLLSDQRGRAEMGRRAYAVYKQRFTRDMNATKWINIIEGSSA